MLSFELCASRIWNYSIMNSQFNIQKLKMRKAHNSKFKNQNSKLTMITADQLKDVLERADALKHYLNIDQK